jgi:HTH-type transcriptional regulator, quorum sensing regulator NprR
MTSLGQKIRNVRRERKMTQIELAKNLVSSSMISQIESDKATPSPQLLEQLAIRLGVKASYFADDMTQKSDLAQTYRRAKSYIDSGQFAAALPLLQSLVNPPSPQFKEETLYTELAQCYEQVGQYTGAATMYENIVRVSLEKNDVPSAVHAYYYLGQLYRKQNQTTFARMFWQRAGELLDRHPHLDMPLALKIHANLGRIYFQLQSFPLALVHYQVAAQLAERYHASLDLAIIQHGMGNVYMEMQQYAEAERFLQTAMQLYHAVRHQRGINQCLVNIGVNMRRRGDVEQAKEHLDTCIKDRDVASDGIRLANAYGERARCHLDQQAYSSAMADGIEALRLDNQTPELQMSVHLTLAKASLALGEAKITLEHCELGMQATDPVRYKVQFTQLLNTERQALDSLGQTREAVASSVKIADQVLESIAND